MAKVTISTITSGYVPIALMNANFSAIADAIENTLSRDGTSPNAMEADLDMNSNRILNLPEPVSDNEPALHGSLQTYVTSASASAAAAAASATAAENASGDLTDQVDLATAAADAAAISATQASGFADDAEADANKIPNPTAPDALLGIRVNGAGTAYELYTVGGGDVFGPASALDGGFVQFDSTTGILI